MRLVVDTNVPVVASRRHVEAPAACITSCLQRLRRIQDGDDILVIDDRWHIIREYRNNLREDGQPGVGDAFLKWVLTNRTNPLRCEQVTITSVDDRNTDHFREFPEDPLLAGFDRSDRKFVAVSLAHPCRPPILNATDRDWWEYRDALRHIGVTVHFVCGDLFSDPG